MDNIFLLPLKVTFETHANLENAGPMAKYMKNLFAFYGIKSPERKALLKQHIQEQGLPEYAEVETIIKEMWAAPQREWHYCAIELFSRYKKHWPQDILSFFEFLIITHSWWDSVDAISTDLVGEFFKHHPGLMAAKTTEWIESDDIWLQRTAIIFQRRYKANTNAELLFSHIRRRVDSEEFFIRKGIGWALREYAKTNPQAVLNFANETALSPLSRREALKHIL